MKGTELISIMVQDFILRIKIDIVISYHKELLFDDLMIKNKFPYISMIRSTG